MKIRFIVSFLLFSFVTHMFGGFVEGTLVKTPDGYVPIEQLYEGDAVVSIVPDQSEHIVTITQIRSYLPDAVYQVVLEDELFVCDGKQKLYDPITQEWVETKDFRVEHVLCDSYGHDLPLLSVSKLSEPKTVYELSVASPHTFLVGRSEVLVHNVVPVVFGISFAFGAGGITLEGITCAIAGIGLAAYNFFKGKQKIKVKPHIETFSPPASAPTPDPDNEEKKKDEKKEGSFEFSQDDLEHMFDTREGHLPDTPYNRKRILDMVSNKSNFKGPDSFGKNWYSETLNDGTQLWAHIRNNKIRDCGLNMAPIEFNPKTGLCKLHPPRVKSKF